MTGFSTSVDKNTNFRLIDGIRIQNLVSQRIDPTHLELSSDSIEKPSMRVDFLLIFGFENKNNLYWDEIILIVRLREYELGCCVNRKLSGILLNMACYF